MTHSELNNNSLTISSISIDNTKKSINKKENNCGRANSKSKSNNESSLISLSHHNHEESINHNKDNYNCDYNCDYDYDYDYNYIHCYNSYL